MRSLESPLEHGVNCDAKSIVYATPPDEYIQSSIPIGTEDEKLGAKNLEMAASVDEAANIGNDCSTPNSDTGNPAAQTADRTLVQEAGPMVTNEGQKLHSRTA